MKPYLVSVLSVFLMSGCTQHYISPTSGPISKIRFVNHSDSKLQISYFDESTKCVGRRATETILPKAQSEHIVGAEREITFQYYLSDQKRGTEQYCLTNLRFHPNSNRIYLFQTVQASKICGWSMSDVTVDGSPVLVPLTNAGWTRGFSDASSWCRQ